MPESARAGFREFLPSANQALRDLEEATGKPVMVMEAPELKVLATIRQAGAQDASHLLRIQGGSNRVADYLIVYECRMALRDGPGPRVVVKDKWGQRERVISAMNAAYAVFGGDLLGKADDPINLFTYPRPCWRSRGSCTLRRPMPCSSRRCGWHRWASWPRWSP
jgi:hypothetical protein